MMHIKIRNLHLNTMLYLGFGTILMFVAIIAIIALIEFSRMWLYSHHLYTHVFEVNRTLRDIQRNINAVETYTFHSERTQNREALIAEYGKDEKETEKSFRFLYHNYTGPKTDIDSAFIAYNIWKPVQTSIDTFGYFSKQKLLMSRQISKWLQVMTDYNFNTVDRFFIKAQKERKGMKYLFGIVISLTFISSGIIIYLFILGIKNPLKDLTSVTRQFSNGNYKTRSNFKADNELGLLADSFNRLASSVDSQYEQLIEQSQTLSLQKNELFDKYGELAVEKERAESADRLKTAFLLNMSHELRTPLNSIIGFSGILLQQLPGTLNEEQIKQLKMIQLSGRHLLSLINDILDISKIEAGEMKPDLEFFDLNEVVEEVVNQILPSAKEKGLLLTYPVKLSDGRIENDRKRITQVLINLINNAVKFTVKGFVRITCCRDKKWVFIDISDSGIGIKDIDLKNLFTPFLQLENNLVRNYEGSGLGLSISRKLVELLHGSIDVKSQYDVGTTFTVKLPILQKELFPEQ